MTSRDLTENVEQLQVRSLAGAGPRPGRRRAGPAGAARRRARRRWSWPAARTTSPRRPPRSASGSPRAADELLVAYDRLERAASPATRCAASRARSAPPRTCSTCSAATPAKLAELEQRVAAHLGFDQVLTSRRPGLPALAGLRRASPPWCSWRPAPSSLATTIRLMAGHELVTEGFKPGQVGSSAMPHKMNTRSCERVNGLAVVLRGYLSMVGELAGDQWNEGDVSCSVVRRVALPDAFFAARRAVRDLPHRARRVRRLPRGDRSASWTATCPSSPPPRC